jgi:murein peptide amidase A
MKLSGPTNHEAGRAAWDRSFSLNGSSMMCPPVRRSVAKLLDPLNELTRKSSSLVDLNSPSLAGEVSTAPVLPGYLHLGPLAGDAPIRIGIFAGIHGDEPAGAYAAVKLLQVLEQNPHLAQGYCLMVYPVCNPHGFEQEVRESRHGKDLNREFWQGSAEPEVQWLEKELRTRNFHGLISLHSDDTSHGLYGFAGGAMLTKHLLEPALRAAEDYLPRNHDGIIDGFRAKSGIIKQGYPGILSAPASQKPKPFEVILETPQNTPQYLQENAHLAAMLSVLAEYRRFIAYGANL